MAFRGVWVCTTHAVKCIPSGETSNTCTRVLCMIRNLYVYVHVMHVFAFANRLSGVLPLVSTSTTVVTYWQSRSRRQVCPLRCASTLSPLSPSSFSLPSLPIYPLQAGGGSCLNTVVLTLSSVWETYPDPTTILLHSVWTSLRQPYVLYLHVHAMYAIFTGLNFVVKLYLQPVQCMYMCLCM